MLWIIMCAVGFVTVLAVISWLSGDSWPYYWTPPAMSSWKSVAATAVGLGLVVLVTLLLRMDDADQAKLGEGAADKPASSTSTVPPSTATSTRSIEPRQTREGSKRPAASAPRIETTTATYFGRPFGTVEIPGRYRGIQGSRELRVQLQRGSEWTQFPLPVVTQESGEFRAYVYLGRSGTYRLRIVDPEERRSSRLLTLQLS